MNRLKGFTMSVQNRHNSAVETFFKIIRPQSDIMKRRLIQLHLSEYHHIIYLSINKWIKMKKNTQSI